MPAISFSFMVSSCYFTYGRMLIRSRGPSSLTHRFQQKFFIPDACSDSHIHVICLQVKMWNENMELTTCTLPAQKHIALVAHDHSQDMLDEWVARHQALLAQHILYATGTTGNLVSPGYRPGRLMPC